MYNIYGNQLIYLGNRYMMLNTIYYIKAIFMNKNYIRFNIESKPEGLKQLHQHPKSKLVLQVYTLWLN